MLSSTWRCSELKRNRCMIWRKSNRSSWGISSLPLLRNIKRRTKCRNRWINNSRPRHLRQGRNCFLFSMYFPWTISFSNLHQRTWESPQKYQPWQWKVFTDHLLRLQAVFRVTRKNATVDVGHLWYLECIFYHILFCSPLCNVDSKQINRLISVFIYHWFHFVAMFFAVNFSFLIINASNFSFFRHR